MPLGSGGFWAGTLGVGVALTGDPTATVTDAPASVASGARSGCGAQPPTMTRYEPETRLGGNWAVAAPFPRASRATCPIRGRKAGVNPSSTFLPGPRIPRQRVVPAWAARLATVTCTVWPGPAALGATLRVGS